MASVAANGEAVKAGGSPAAGPFSAFERMVAWRYLRLRRREAFISVIAGFSFIGIMLGVATLIIVMAVMNGFRTELISRILGINGHMIVQPIDGPLTDYAELTQKFAAVPGVRMALPLVEGQTLASGRGGAGSGALVRGVRPEDLENCPKSPATSNRATWSALLRGRGSWSAPGSPPSSAFPPVTRSR